jgi:hypothetical protein
MLKLGTVPLPEGLSPEWLPRLPSPLNGFGSQTSGDISVSDVRRTMEGVCQ